MNRDRETSLFSMTVMRLITANKEWLFSYLNLLFGSATNVLHRRGCGNGSGNFRKIGLGFFGQLSVQLVQQIVHVVISVIVRGHNGIHFLDGEKVRKPIPRCNPPDSATSRAIAGSPPPSPYPTIKLTDQPHLPDSIQTRSRLSQDVRHVLHFLRLGDGVQLQGKTIHASTSSSKLSKLLSSV